MDNVSAARAFDRRLFLWLSIGFAAVVIGGFGPTYYMKPFTTAPALPSVVVHLHGLVMTAWVALFGAQVWLISSRRVRVHQRLGLAAVALAVVIVFVGTVTAVRAAKYGSTSTPAGITPLSFLAVPLFDLLMFVIFFGGAVYFRKQPTRHKMLMLLTMVNFLPPALARIPVGPLQALGPLWFFGAPAGVALLCVGLDWRRRGQLNQMFAGGTVLLIGSYVVRLALMTTEPWMRFAGWLTSFV